MLRTRAWPSSVLKVLQTTSRSRATVGNTFRGLNPSVDAARWISQVPTTRIKLLTPSLSARCSNGPFDNANALREASFPDPERPDLYYHLVGPPTPVSKTQPAFALSFLPTAPKTADSCTIIGWLPAVHEEQGSGEGAGLNDFKENENFRDLLHRAIQEGLKEDVDAIQANRAIQLQSGWMHIHDERNLPALGRIGDPDDIIASVLVEDGKILPETYQPMPAYRLCTTDGVAKLTPGLATKLQAFLNSQGT